MRDLDPEGRIPVKALLPFLGKRIIDFQVEALAASPFVERIYLLGLCKELAQFDLPVEYVPMDLVSDPAEKLAAGLQFLIDQGYKPSLIVVSTSDAPGVTQATIDDFLSRLPEYLDYDFVLSLVPEGIAERDFPKSGRVVARFRDHQVFPGELYALSPRAIMEGRKIITEINQRRRKIDRQATKISMAPLIRYIARRPRTWPLLLKYGLGRATLADAENVVSLAFGGKVKGIIIPDAGFGMDIDLPGDYQRLKEYVKRQNQMVNQQVFRPT